MPFAQEKMGFSRPPKLFLRNDPQNAADPLGKTGFYDPQAESITLYTTGRHPKDIMRSLAHELQHHTQKCNGDFANASNMGEQGYAQADPHMRSMEIEAYKASIVFRDWEDSLKETIYYEHLQKGDKSSMSTKDWKNGELKSLLAESWGFKMDLNELNEAGDPTGIESPSKSGAKKADKSLEGEDEGKEGMEDLKEDSGEEEKRHYEDDDWHDKDRIEAIRRHLDALERDKDYDHDHESLEEDGAKRKGDPRLRRPDADRLRESVVKLRKAGLSEVQIKKLLSTTISKAFKG